MTETFAVEFPCDLACRVELDLSDLQPQFTLRQMRRAVDGVHQQVHDDPEAPVRVEYTVTNLRAAAREKAGAR